MLETFQSSPTPGSRCNGHCTLMVRERLIVSILTDSWEPVQHRLEHPALDRSDVSILTDSWEPVQRTITHPSAQHSARVSILTDSWEPVQRRPA